jgi:muconolactone delta-isomerase
MKGVGRPYGKIISIDELQCVYVPKRSADATSHQNWEEHSPLMFEQLKAKGCLAYSYNQIWNSPGTFKTSAIFEYESPEAFKACQQVMKGLWPVNRK